MRALWQNESGAAAVEYAIIATMLFVLTFGIIDWGYMLFQWEQAEKATQIGARVAVVRAPVAAVPSGSGTVGTPCAGSTMSGTPCYFAPLTVNCGSAACGDIVTQMQAVYPRIQPANVQITYSPSGLGSVTGTGSGMPLISIVTVSLVNMNYNFFALSAFIPALGNSIPIPEIPAALTSEGFCTSTTCS